jgi:hypothetical protein
MFSQCSSKIEMKNEDRKSLAHPLRKLAQLEFNTIENFLVMKNGICHPNKNEICAPMSSCQEKARVSGVPV